MEIIKLEHGEVGKLAQAFKVSMPTVRKALNGKTKSILANMLRKAALERGGIAFQTKVSATKADFDTEFKTSENKMIQTFSDQIKIIADLTTGDAGIYKDGKLQSTYRNLTMKELASVQTEAQRMADELYLNS